MEMEMAGRKRGRRKERKRERESGWERELKQARPCHLPQQKGACKLHELIVP